MYKINLYHEHLQKRRQHELDPLRMGVLVLMCVGVLLAGHYVLRIASSSSIIAKAMTLEKKYVKVQAQEKEIKEKEENFNKETKIADSLLRIVNEKVLWAPILSEISDSISEGIMLNIINGRVQEEPLADLATDVGITIDGTAEADAPRQRADEFRRNLEEKIQTKEKTTTAKFKSLDDVERGAGAGVGVGGNIIMGAKPKVKFTIEVKIEKEKPKDEATGIPAERKKRRASTKEE